MGFYCVYVGCFWIATRFEQNDNDDDSSNGKQRLAAYTGAAIGGIGAGFLWTSQGAYFAQAAEEHAAHLQQSVSISTSFLAGVFAFFYLAEEVFLRMLSTVLVGILSWESIFGLYTVVTLVSTMAMPLVYSYPRVDDDDDGITSRTSSPPSTTVFYKVTAAGQLLWKDPKMKWMIGLNAVFGFTSAFLNSYVNGQVVPVALNDPDSRYIGALSSWVSAVAAGMSLVFGRIAASSSLSTSTSSSSSSSSSFGSKGSILILGAVCFLGVVFPFLIEPNAEKYGWSLLIMVYTLHGVGRATFEGTLKATFADYFSYEKEGAFANIILQNGLSGAIGYVCEYHVAIDPFVLLLYVQSLLFFLTFLDCPCFFASTYDEQ